MNKNKNVTKRRYSVLGCVLKEASKSWSVTLALLFSVGAAVVFGLIPPAILEKAVDLLTNPGNKPAIDTLSLGLLYFAATAAAGLSESAREVFITVFGQRLTHALRSEVCLKIQRLPSSSLASEKTGNTVSLITGDVGTVERLFESGIIGMTADIVSVIGIWIMICRRNMGLAIVLIPAFPAVYYFTRFFKKTALKAHSEGRRAAAEAVGILPETLKNIRTVKVYRCEKFAEDRYGSAVKAGFDAAEKSNFCDAVYSPVITAFSAGLVAFVMIMASNVTGASSFFGMSVGTSVAVVAYIGKIFGPIESIGMEIQNIQSAVAGIKRIDGFLALDERKIPDGISRTAKGAEKREVNLCECTENDDISALSSVPTAIEIENLSFRYTPDTPVIDGFSLKIATGANITLAGRTGVGKSTCLKLVEGLYSPDRGSCKVFGIPSDDIPDSEKRLIFGYVEQGFRPVPGSIRDQITLGDPRADDGKVKNALQIAGLEELVGGFENGLETRFDAISLSEGQLQLMSVARAVVLEPRILLLDEITANLDSVTEDAVLSSIKAASVNRTVLSVSHRLYERSGKESGLVFMN